MRVWVDAQLSPALAEWMRSALSVDSVSLRSLGLHRAKDQEIFSRARAEGVVVMTKDADFVELVERLGTPPQIVWLRCGNTSNARLREILTSWWPHVQALLAAGERIVEIAERRTALEGD